MHPFPSSVIGTLLCSLLFSATAFAADPQPVLSHQPWYRAERVTQLRQEVRLSSPVVALIPAGALVKLMRKPNDLFAQVTTEEGKKGYVMMADLRLFSRSRFTETSDDASSSATSSYSSVSSSSSSAVSSVSPAPTPTPSPLHFTHRVTSLQLHLRMDSRAESFSLRTLGKGNELLLLQMLKNGWAKVQLSDGTTGYVHAGFIEAIH